MNHMIAIFGLADAKFQTASLVKENALINDQSSDKEMISDGFVCSSMTGQVTDTSCYETHWHILFDFDGNFVQIEGKWVGGGLFLIKHFYIDASLMF